MSFINPEYFWLLLFVLAAFVKKDLSSLRLVSYGYIATFLLLILALTRPVIEQEPIKTKELLSDVVLGVDLSFSMQAQDIHPTRLEFAKSALKQIVKSEQKSRFGVFAFTTNAIILSPLTSDSALLLHLFSALDHKLIMTRGSSVLPALRLARKMSSSKTLSVVLLSDGADELNYSKELAFAKQNNLVVNILMIATKLGSSLRLENNELLKDELGEIVITRQNSAIASLAQGTGGVYTQNVEEILLALDSQRDELHTSDVTLVQNRELFYYFVAMAIFVFLVTNTTLKRYVLIFLLFFGIELSSFSLDDLKNKNFVAFDKGVELYSAGEYEASLESFKDVKSSNAEVKAIVFYNIANSYVRLKEFAKAREAYEKSLTLRYTKEADENLQYIKEVKEQQNMTTGQQKTPKQSEDAKQKESSQKNESAGSSNMKVSASSGDGKQENGKKSLSAPKIDLNAARTKLSSKQYELINKRQIDEKKPY